MVSVNTNMSYIQATVGLKESFLHGSVALMNSYFLSGFSPTHSDTNPLVEGSACRRDLYLTTHNTNNRHTSMPRRDSNIKSQQVSGRGLTP